MHNALMAGAGVEGAPPLLKPPGDRRRRHGLMRVLFEMSAKTLRNKDDARVLGGVRL
jgi:hypothetical protein